MLEFLFDLPLVITGPAMVGSLCLFGLAGLVLVRRRVFGFAATMRALRRKSSQNKDLFPDEI
jgi:hypothetical protein